MSYKKRKRERKFASIKDHHVINKVKTIKRDGQKQLDKCETKQKERILQKNKKAKETLK